MQDNDDSGREQPAETKNEVNLTLKMRQKSVIDRVGEIDWQTTSSAPYVVELDPTTACNLACPDCISRDLLNQGFFSRKRIRDLTREMVDAGVKAVVLIGGGEPLAHPEIGWVMDYLGNNDVRVGLTTNGVLMDRYMEVIAEHASWVRVSMDAATPETFQRIRPSISGVSQFGKVVENMRVLAKLKQGTLGYSFMIYSEGRFDRDEAAGGAEPADEMAEARLMAAEMIKAYDDRTFSNVSEIYQGGVLAKEIGCDYYEIKPMYDIRHFAIVQRQSLVDQAKVQVEQCLRLQDDAFRVLRATKLQHVLAVEGNIEQKDYTRCAVAQLRTLVTPSGVYVCPYFRGRPEMKIGDVTKTSFSEMWHGERRAEVLKRVNPSRVCQMHCIRHHTNLFLEGIIGEDEAVETVDDFDRFI